MASALSSKVFRLLLPILIIGIAVAIAAYLISTKPQPKPVTVTEKAWLVKIENAQLGEYSPDLTLYGKLDSLWSTQITSSIEADVLAVNVIEGDKVQKGQLLIKLDERDVQLQLAQREADLTEAEANIAAEQTRHAANLQSLPRERRLLKLTQNEVKRLQNLVSRQASARSSLDNAQRAMEQQAISLTNREQSIAEHKSRLAQAEARLARVKALRDQTQLDLERSQIKAPFNGVVSRQLTSPGKRVRMAEPLIELYDSDALVLRAQIPNRYLATVRQAMANNIQLKVSGEIDGEIIEAELRSLSGEVTTGSGGVTGLFTLQTTLNNLQKGRFVRLTMQLPPQQNLLALPHEAIYGADRIYRVDDENRMRPMQIKRVGEARLGSGQARVLVRSDALNDTLRIVTTQLPNALNGLLIREADGD